MAVKVQTWNIPSSTNPNKLYEVAQFEDGTFGCTCPGWTFKRAGQNRQCTHIISIQVLRGNTGSGSVMPTRPVDSSPTGARKFRI